MKEVKQINIKLWNGVPADYAIRCIGSIGNANHKCHHAVEIENPHVPENSTVVDIGGIDDKGVLRIDIHWSKDVK